MKWYGPVVMKSFILVASFVVSANAEVFTALVDLEPLLRTEGEIVKTLERYLAVEEQRLENLRRLRGEYVRLHVAAMDDVDTFLSNPVNAYLLVKRLTTDWKTAGRLIEGAYSRAVFENITQDFIFPDDEDLSGAAAALLRLQDTYLLETSKLARGEIEGTNTTSQLSAADCYELGYQAYKVQDYYHTVLWLQEALNRFEEDEVEIIHKYSILELLAYGTSMLGNGKHAVKVSEDLLQIAPDHPRGHVNLAYYQMQLENIEREKRGDTGSEEIETEPPTLTQPVQLNQAKSRYEHLCRGERVKSHLEESLLHCRYTSSDSSYLLLQPVKEEVLNIDPRIVIYHDVISDKDAEIIKQLSQPKLARATVQNPASGAYEFAHYRVSKSAWLSDKDHLTIARSSRLIEEITNLETDTAEQLQIVNYGIGGHYEPHFDFRRDDETDTFEFLGTGNRIATWIYYLSDVDAGGATAFTDIGVIAKPRKGSAGFWYNLYKNGKGDLRTKHGGCPVLAGTKWVANKWLHEKGQEFRRTCSLNPYE